MSTQYLKDLFELLPQNSDFELWYEKTIKGLNPVPKVYHKNLIKNGWDQAVDLIRRKIEDKIYE